MPEVTLGRGGGFLKKIKIKKSQRPLSPSAALVRSVANDKGDNEIILEDCAQISWHFPGYKPTRRNYFEIKF